MLGDGVAFGETEVHTRYGERADDRAQPPMRESAHQIIDLTDNDLGFSGRQRAPIARQRPENPEVIDLTDSGGVSGLELVDDRLDSAIEVRVEGAASIIKRTLDVLVALLGIILLLPIWLTIALAIRLTSPGPAVFTQPRVGQGGKVFTVRKFRTMLVDADDILTEILRNDPAMRDKYATFHKLREDPRVTGIGRLLRRTSLDEIPQLWNVLVGDMSLVGPRPYLPREICEMNSLESGLLECRPGLTGLWQISGRNDLSFDERLVIDLTYAGSWSLSLDAKILLKTVPVVLTGSGAS